MVFASAEIILFGVQAGVRLFGASRQAYIDRTRERDLTLPLPGVDHTADVGQAESYFAVDPDGVRHLAESERLRELHGEVERDRGAFEQDRDSATEYIQAFVYFRGVDKGLTQDGLAPADILALTTVAQWKKGQTPHPTALKRIAGTLVEIGIDYFAEGPGKGKIGGNTPAKRVLREVLVALDDHSFATEGLDGVVETIFVTTLDSIAEDAALVTNDPKMQAFVGSVAKGLVADVNARLEKLPAEQRLFGGDQFGETTGMVFRSLLRHGAGAVLANPSTLLEVADEDSGALISRVGSAVLDTILPSADSPLDLTAVMSSEGVDRIVRAGLSVVVDHPGLLQLDGDGQTGLRQMLLEVSQGLLADSRKLGPDLLPDLTRLVLERTAGNLHLMWDPDGDEEHLLVTGVKTLLTSLAKEPAEGTTWSLAFSKSTLVDVAEAVLDEVAANPGMITDKIGGSVPVKAAVEAAIGELARLDLDEISASSVSGIVKVSIRAAAGRMDFLDRFKIGTGKTKAAAGHVLGAVLSVAFPEDGENPRAAWALAKSSVLEAVTEIAFRELGEAGVDAKRVKVLQTVLDEVVQSLEQKEKFSIESFAVQLKVALAA